MERKPMPYSDKETAEAQRIAALDRDEWYDAITKSLSTHFPNRRYGTVWQKVHSYARGFKKRKKVEHKKRKGNQRQIPGTQLAVSQNELRFEVKGMRVEATQSGNLEFVVSI